jgi:hypothetical protein
MKISGDFLKGLRDPDSAVASLEITDEVRARLIAASDELSAILMKRTRNPAEGYLVLHFMIEALRESMGLQGTAILDRDEHMQ